MSQLDLAPIGNGHVAALIDTSATVVWTCRPRLDGDPVFNALLGGAGRFGMRLENQTSCEQRFVRNTAILVTELEDRDGGRLRITDHCPKFRQNGRDFRPPALVRRVQVLAGAPALRVELAASFDYNADAAEPQRGVNHVTFGPESGKGEAGFRLTTDAPVGLVLDGTAFVPDREIAFVLTDDAPLSESPRAIARLWEAKTRRWWRDWVGTLALPLDHQPAVVRAAVTLKLCVFEETGGIVAALTTSIPEHEGSERNWDYRYCWVRDAYFTVSSLSRLSDHSTRSHYARWLMSVIAGRCGDYVNPLYGIGLENEIEEWFADDLPGFSVDGGPGHGPVRVGNAAWDQVQHDVYGQIVLSLAPLFVDERLDARFGEEEFAMLERVARRAAEVWDTPDAGVWEFRSISDVHTSSAMFCWAACDRVAKIASHLGLSDREAHWRTQADTMRDGILERAWNPERRALTAAFGGTDLDASLLLMAELGLVRSDDERFRATVERIDEELREGAHVYRYLRADDFGTPETAFTACTMWHIEALHRVGREDDAREMFAAVLEARNAFGLLSEDIHPDTLALWGNYPQTYCLAGIIDCARRLSRPWTELM